MLESQQASPARSAQAASFLFLYFSKKKFTEIYFWFQVLQFYTPTARQGGGRGPTDRQVGGRDLYVNKNKFILRRGPWREAAGHKEGFGNPVVQDIRCPEFQYRVNEVIQGQSIVPLRM